MPNPVQHVVMYQILFKSPYIVIFIKPLKIKAGNED